MLDFANPGGIRLHKSEKNIMCPQMLLCDVISAPAETVVEWFYNGKMIRSSSTGALGQLLMANNNNDADGKGQLGLSETSHRLCIPEMFTRQVGQQLKRGGGTPMNSAVVSCRARLACNPSKWLESDQINLAPILIARRAERAISGATKAQLQMQMPKAPIIYLVTSSRMDVAGTILQILCRSTGNPKPKNEWTVFAMDGMRLEKEEPIEDYPFIMKMNNGDLLVDTSMTENASMSLRCRAINGVGEDSENSTIILLKE